MASVALPRPPEIEAQAQAAAPITGGGAGSNVVSILSGRPGQAPAQGDVLGQFQNKIFELRDWMVDTMRILEVLHPPTQAVLVPVSKVGQVLEQVHADLTERMQRNTPALPAPDGMPGPDALPRPVSAA